jgi:hypothetical protein
MERYLLSVDQSLDIKDKLLPAETVCNVEYQGSSVYKDIQILVSPNQKLVPGLSINFSEDAWGQFRW